MAQLPLATPPPFPCQPSPLSFSSVSEDQGPSPLPSPALGGADFSSRLRQPSGSSHHSTPRVSSGTIPTTASQNAQLESLLPIKPVPDSLLFKHTLSALDSSASTFKRLSKTVLAYAAVAHTLSEQLEKAEDDLFGAVAELGRWLESGYDVQIKGEKSGIWEDDGIRKINKEKRRRERVETEVRIEQGLKDVKAHLKRRGLAGGGAQNKYETNAKQFYHATSVYLAPQSPPPSSSHTQQASASSTASHPAYDQAQAVRLAQWDLTRYTHHSMLLSAAPPSSEELLNLLVGLYGWAGAIVGEHPAAVLEGIDENSSTMIRRSSQSRPEQLRRSTTPVQTPQHLKTSLSSCLSQLASTRSDLLAAWAQREEQTRLLQDEVYKRQTELDVWQDNSSNVKVGEGLELGLSQGSGNAMASVSSSGVEYKKPKKTKLGRSMGGRLREFLSPSSSSYSLASGSTTTLASNMDRSSRASFDGARRETKGEPIRRSSTIGIDKLSTHKETPDYHIKSTPTLVATKSPPTPTSILPPASSHDTSTSMPTPSVATHAAASMPPPPPPKETARPLMTTRHSVHMPGADYIAPLITTMSSPTDYDASIKLPSPFESSPDLRLGISSEKLRHSMDSSRPLNFGPSPTPSLTQPEQSAIGLGHPTGASIGVGGVGGLGAGGDEDEQREEAGRKKEGVLWGMGTWEGLNKGAGGKGKWEKYWVVLDHSSIFEYRDDGSSGPPGGAHAAIDLKFASVREGRGTDRRFVFEIVTPSQGRRLYQATSDQEMKQWLYAICNAIESCINGTSTVRTIDQTKGRGPSGAYDDHALPTRSKYNLAFSGRSMGLGLIPNGRKSMPPTPVERDTAEPRTRKTSLKKVLKSSGERFSTAMAGGSGSSEHPEKPKRNSFGGLEISRPVFGKGANRQSLPPSAPETASRRAEFSQSQLLPPISTPPGVKSSWADGEIEKRVLEMAGLGLGSSPTTATRLAPGESPTSAKRRVKSEAVRKHSQKHQQGGEGMTRSKSDDGQLDEADEKRVLRKIAAEEGNSRCADCGGGMKASRWATISLHGKPIVLFLCIRCIGIHRSLGTHISKTRSVDMDNWTLKQVASAREWGNIRANTVWEALLEGGHRPASGDELKAFVKSKYVDGKWLKDEDRARFGFSS
ncbi:hypothetical protein L202_03557 [Cryptococcus amylolentus CBS 6039]|uniref:Arf-GAP domain-containing protein n=1 Tax=Cryptococcus amylolentus CBS 6039 TaxID=1295533 RepID=A0A1E3HTF2_9TREE|nr:hypothetical protein L202_03557 [Cryptococcus amylolentus CBS 6039]ODN79614.1 hypothetical protein L202_03557 [Cryptococcus amylolentus CBS 6039]